MTKKVVCEYHDYNLEWKYQLVAEFIPLLVAEGIVPALHWEEVLCDQIPAVAKLEDIDDDLIRGLD